MTRRRAPEGIPVLISLDPNASDSLSRQIYRALRDGILAGRLAGGLRLPSTRALAVDLGVSRNTVVTAFDQLLAEGYVESRVGRGHAREPTMPDHLLHTRARPRVRRDRRLPANGPSARGARLVGARAAAGRSIEAGDGAVRARRSGARPVSVAHLGSARREARLASSASTRRATPTR